MKHNFLVLLLFYYIIRHNRKHKNVIDICFVYINVDFVIIRVVSHK